MGNKAKRTIEREEAIKARQSKSPKQIRARARRAGQIQSEAIAQLYKPIEEWDEEELARGRPRAKDGTFKGVSPDWISREIHEESVRRFQAIVKGHMNVNTVAGLKVITDILDDDEKDDNGRPIVLPSVKLDAAKFLIEHVIGKPTQKVEADISVRLQGILGMAMVPAGEMPILESPNIIDIDEDEEEESSGE